MAPTCCHQPPPVLLQLAQDFFGGTFRATASKPPQNFACSHGWGNCLLDEIDEDLVFDGREMSPPNGHL
jgi:hypothetical protein